MPCATIHLTLANAVLTHWSAAGRASPFDPHRPELRDAFLHGAIAPDMGYVPGVDRFFSDLVHYIEPGELARALLSRAADAADVAFGWGWATHLVGDQLLHPVVGRAVGERLHGDPERRVDAAEDVSTHVSIEVGLDVIYYLRDPSAAVPPARPHFDPSRIERLREALRDTYRHDWEAEALLAGHRRAVRLTRWWPLAMRVLGSRRGWPPSEPRGGTWRTFVSGTLGLARAVAARGEAASGFFAAERPASWVVRRFDAIVAEFPENFARIVEEGARAIPDRNLETGGPAGEGRGHPASDRVAELLGRSRRASIQRSS